MVELLISPHKNILFETTLIPSFEIITKLKNEADIGEGEIKTILGKKNKVAVGEPYYENLITRYNQRNEEIPNEIKNMAKIYDFHFVSLTCSFLPDMGCKYIWARFGIELTARSMSGDLLKERPIAYDMFPDKIFSTQRIKKTINFEPKLQLKLSNVIAANLSLGKKNKTSEFIIYEPEIIAYGSGRPSVSWDFRSTIERGIWGNNYLLLVVRTPKNSFVKGKFIIAAEVELYIDRPFRINLMRKKKESLIKAEYDLSAGSV